MKLLIEPQSKNKLYQDKVDGLILSLKDYAVQSPIYYTVEEIKKSVDNALYEAKKSGKNQVVYA